MLFTAHAPVRAVDLGGWTDTWFATTGTVCSVALQPGVTVRIQLDAFPGRAGLTMRVGNSPDVVARLDGFDDHRDPLLWTAVASSGIESVDGSLVEISSPVPAGSGLGTSASVVVALLASLEYLRAYETGCAPETLRNGSDRLALAQRAHRVETGLGLQSGVQDQCAAAVGGIRKYDFVYPEIVAVSEPVFGCDYLRDRLVTVYLGQPHTSSAIHEGVIARLEQTDPEPFLAPLRTCADNGYRALLDGDFDAFGLAMNANTQAQAALDARLISDDAQVLIDLAASLGAFGSKVNGAGGNGGSVSILGPPDHTAHLEMLQRIRANSAWTILPLDLADTGVQVHFAIDPVERPH
jgi:D-glycero-alpha-D-manno-heptose-7-phosphate kinase